MNITIDQKAIEHLRTGSIVQQSTLWAQMKSYQGIKPNAFRYKIKEEEVFNTVNCKAKYQTDDLLVLLQYIDDQHSIAYIPYGPKIEPTEEYQGPFLEELSETLRSYLPGNCILIRYDLLWESPWAKDNDCYDYKGNWLGPPAKRNQEFRFNFNTQKWNLRKTNSDILPANTIFIDLKKDSDVLLKKMKPKTRYNIRLSLRKGVEVKHVGIDNLDIWYELYKQTADRNKIRLHHIDYFRSILLARNACTGSSEDIELLIAEYDGIPLAAMFLSISGKRGSYLYGASASEKRNLMATYALQWEAMYEAKKRGCVEYDMFGIAPNPTPSHPMYGLYRYKTGFGGNIFHRMGCWDYPLHNKKYECFKATEMTDAGYHKR